MNKKIQLTADNAPDALETAMQKVSRIVSIIALGLMIVGFVDLLASETAVVMPGSSIPSLTTLLSLSQTPVSLATMSVGALLLALLPSVRVLLALRLYVRQRDVVDTIVALVVLLELLLSMRAGG